MLATPLNLAGLWVVVVRNEEHPFHAGTRERAIAFANATNLIYCRGDGPRNLQALEEAYRAMNAAGYSIHPFPGQADFSVRAALEMTMLLGDIQTARIENGIPQSASC